MGVPKRNLTFLQLRIIKLALPDMRLHAFRLKFKSGRNEVYVFVNDPDILGKILIPDPRSDGNFDP